MWRRSLLLTYLLNYCCKFIHYTQPWLQKKFARHIAPVKFLGSQNRILYQQLISAKQFQLKQTKYLRIVSFKTTLDLEVKITSSTCKISWIAELNPLSTANLISLIHNLQTVKIDKKKILQIVSFKTPLDLQVKITSSTCKISWVTEQNPLSTVNCVV